MTKEYTLKGTLQVSGRNEEEINDLCQRLLEKLSESWGIELQITDEELAYGQESNN